MIRLRIDRIRFSVDIGKSEWTRLCWPSIIRQPADRQKNNCIAFRVQHA